MVKCNWCILYLVYSNGRLTEKTKQSEFDYALERKNVYENCSL